MQRRMLAQGLPSRHQFEEPAQLAFLLCLVERRYRCLGLRPPFGASASLALVCWRSGSSFVTAPKHVLVLVHARVVVVVVVVPFRFARTRVRLDVSHEADPTLPIVQPCESCADPQSTLPSSLVRGTVTDGRFWRRLMRDRRVLRGGSSASVSEASSAPKDGIGGRP
jgi:hypothetical protein